MAKSIDLEDLIAWLECGQLGSGPLVELPEVIVVKSLRDWAAVMSKHGIQATNLLQLARIVELLVQPLREENAEYHRIQNERLYFLMTAAAGTAHLYEPGDDMADVPEDESNVIVVKPAVFKKLLTSANVYEAIKRQTENWSAADLAELRKRKGDNDTDTVSAE